MTDKPSTEEASKAAQVLQTLLEEHDVTVSNTPTSTLHCEIKKPNSVSLVSADAPKQVTQHIIQIPAQTLGQNTWIIYVRPTPQPSTSGQVLLECSDVTKNIGIVGGGSLTPEAIAKIVAANAAKFGNQGVTKYVLTYSNSSIGSANAKAKETDKLPGTVMTYRTPGATNVNKSGNIKRPMNAFMVWARDYRAKLSASMPNATNSDISIRLGQLWSQMSSEEKRPYYQEADNIKRQHRKDYPDWVYKPSPTRKKEEAAPTQHSVLWARYTQSKGLTTAEAETKSNPVQLSPSGNITSSTESTIPLISINNSTMHNQVTHLSYPAKSSSDQVANSILLNTSEQHQNRSVNSGQTDSWNTIISSQLVCPYEEAIYSNAENPQQNVSSIKHFAKQVVDASAVKKTALSSQNDTANSCSVSQQTSFLSVESVISTSSLTPVESSSREDSGKERNEPCLIAQHTSFGNNHAKDSDSSASDFNSDKCESVKSRTTHDTSSWTSHVHTQGRNCIKSKTGTKPISGSGSTSLSGFQSNVSCISSNSYNDDVLSLHASDSSRRLTKSSSAERSAVSFDSTSKDDSTTRSGSLLSSHGCSLTSSNNTFQQSLSSCNFPPTVSSSSNCSWDSSTNSMVDDSFCSSISENSRQSSSKLLLNKETSIKITPSSSFTKSALSNSIDSSSHELSSSLLVTPSKADGSTSSFILCNTEQSSNASILGQESTSSSRNSDVSFMHVDPKQRISTFGQYSNIGALKQVKKVTAQEPVTHNESERDVHLDTSSSSGSLQMGKEYSINLAGKTKINQNGKKTVTKVIPIGNTTRTITDQTQTQTSSLRRLLTAKTLPADIRPPESPALDHKTLTDRSLVYKKQPVHGTYQSQPTKSNEGNPTNISQVQTTERKHSTSSKVSRRKINKYDNTGNSRIMVKKMYCGKSSDEKEPMAQSSFLVLDGQTDKDDKIKYLYHGFLDPYDPFFYEGETLYSEYFPDALEVDVTKWNQYLESEEKEQHVKVDNLDTCFKSEPGLDSCHSSSDIDLFPLPLSTTLISGQNATDIMRSSDSNCSQSKNISESLSQDAVFSATESSGTEKETAEENDSLEAFSNEENCFSDRLSARNTFLCDHTYTEVSNSSESNICRPKSISKSSYGLFTSLTSSNDTALRGHATSFTISTLSSEARSQEPCLKMKIKDTNSDESWKLPTNINESPALNLDKIFDNSETTFVSKICSNDNDSSLDKRSDEPKYSSNYDINITDDFVMSTDTVGNQLPTGEQTQSYSETVNNTKSTQVASKYSTEPNGSLTDTRIEPEYFDHLAAAVSSALKAVEDPFVGANTVEEELMKLDSSVSLVKAVQNICHKTDENPCQQMLTPNVEEERYMERQEPCCSSDASTVESLQLENVQPFEVMDGNKTLRVWKSADGKIVCQMLVSPETMSKECWRITPHVQTKRYDNCLNQNSSFKIPNYSLGNHTDEVESSSRFKDCIGAVLKDEIEKKEDVAHAEIVTVKNEGSDTCSLMSSELIENGITSTDSSATKFHSWGSSSFGNSLMLTEGSTLSSISTSEDELRLFKPLPVKSSDGSIDQADTNDVTVSMLDIGTSESALSRSFSEDEHSKWFCMNRESNSNENNTSSNVYSREQPEIIKSVKEETSLAQRGGELDVEDTKRMVGVNVIDKSDPYRSQDDLDAKYIEQQFINIKSSDRTVKNTKNLLDNNHLNKFMVKQENVSLHNVETNSSSCSIDKKDKMSSPYKRRRSSTDVQIKKVTRRRFVL